MIESDPSIEVRKSLISSLHEIAQILVSDESYKLFEPLIIRLFKDEDSDIFYVLVHRVEVILRSLRKDE